jgi:hypothetical protein
VNDVAVAVLVAVILLTIAALVGLVLTYRANSK